MDITAGAVVELFTAPRAVGADVPLVVQVLKVRVVCFEIVTRKTLSVVRAHAVARAGCSLFAARLIHRAYDDS